MKKIIAVLSAVCLFASGLGNVCAKPSEENEALIEYDESVMDNISLSGSIKITDELGNYGTDLLFGYNEELFDRQKDATADFLSKLMMLIEKDREECVHTEIGEEEFEEKFRIEIEFDRENANENFFYVSIINNHIYARKYENGTKYPVKSCDVGNTKEIIEFLLGAKDNELKVFSETVNEKEPEKEPEKKPEKEPEKEPEKDENNYYADTAFDALTGEGEIIIEYHSKKYDIGYALGFESGKLEKQKIALKSFIDKLIGFMEKYGEECRHKSQYKQKELESYANVNIRLTDEPNKNVFEIEMRDGHLDFYYRGDGVKTIVNLSCCFENTEKIAEFLTDAYKNELSHLEGADDVNYNNDKKMGVIDFDANTLTAGSVKDEFKLMEELEFDFCPDESYEGTVFSEIGKKGEKIHGEIKLLFTGTQYYILTLKGSLGEKQFYNIERSWGFEGMKGHRMTFHTVYTVDDGKMMYLENSETKYDFIHINGDADKNGEVQVSVDYGYNSGNKLALPSNIKATNVSYEYYGTEEFLESGRNLFTLFSLPSKEEYIAKIREEQGLEPEKEPEEKDYADLLKKAGLFKGTNKGYELDKPLTRDESAAMLVRLLGKELVLDKNDYGEIFKDVPKNRWSFAYVMYCYEFGITKGTGKDSFSPDKSVSAEEFTALLLRLMGYTEAEPEAALDMCGKVGILDEDKADEIRKSGGFDRGNMVYIVCRALSSEMKNGYTLADYLSMEGAITEDEAALFEK